jgi:phosphoglycolate phosphatase
LRREAEALGWTRHFKRLVGAQDASADKPNRACIDFALEGSLIEPSSDVWFLGDAAIDMRCALAADCTPILVGTPPADEDFSNARPVCRVEDLYFFYKLYIDSKIQLP